MAFKTLETLSAGQILSRAKEEGRPVHLDPTNLALRHPETFYTLPGGAAAGATTRLAEIAIERIKQDPTHKPSEQITVFLMTHGTSIPWGSVLDAQGNIIFREYNPELEPYRDVIDDSMKSSIPAAVLIDKHHAHTSCGVSQGRSDLTDRLHAAQVDQVRAKYPDVDVVPVKVKTGLFNGWGDIYSLRGISEYAEDINDLKYIIGDEPAYGKLRPVGQVLDRTGFAELIQQAEAKGRIAGVGCIDNRQGLTFPHKSVGTIDTQYAAQLVYDSFPRVAKWLGMQPPFTQWQVEAHTEFPHGFLHLASANPAENAEHPELENAKLLHSLPLGVELPAHYDARYSYEWLYRIEAGYGPNSLYQSQVLFMNLPEEFFRIAEADQSFATAKHVTEQLVGNLNLMMYGVPAKRKARGLAIFDGQYYETPDMGLEIDMPAVARLALDVKKPRRYLNNTSPLDPNPAFIG